MKYNYYNLLGVENYLKEKGYKETEINNIKNIFMYFNDDLKKYVKIGGKFHDFCINDGAIYNEDFFFNVFKEIKGNKEWIRVSLIKKEATDKKVNLYEKIFSFASFPNYMHCMLENNIYKDIGEFLTANTNLSNNLNAMKKVLLPDEKSVYNNNGGKFYCSIGYSENAIEMPIKTSLSRMESFMLAVDEYEKHFKDTIKILKKEV